MRDGHPKTVRCIIYTRVSTEHGLEQDFNSLDAQREASEAYIRSQVHAGWVLGKVRYDDGGFSGGTTDRPALQRLLADIKARKVDVIVVYKVDRLTRSLADFAKLVELFDAHGVSFVSVTQQFNTTTSMGRLTLNVLLSFAQFEREVTSERIRDKIAASKRKGLWVGGMVPLGYTLKDRKVVIVAEEARRVRAIFRRYLELKSSHRLLQDLRKRGIVSKVRVLSTGRKIGGVPFTQGPLAHLLRNRFYIGEVLYRGEICPGPQPAILDRDLFDKVQALLDQQRNHHRTRYQRSDALLMGRIFDDRGNRMSPSFSVKRGVRHRYYVSTAKIQHHPERAGTIQRVPAAEIEDVVTETLRRHISNIPQQTSANVLIQAYLQSITVHADHLALKVKAIDKAAKGKQRLKSADRDPDAGFRIIKVPWMKQAAKRKREIIVRSSSAKKEDDRPIRAEARAILVGAIARGRRWLDELVRGEVATIDQIAKREKCSTRQVNLMISLAFLPPDIVKAAIDGRLPRGVGVEALRDPPAEWQLQRTTIGLTP